MSLPSDTPNLPAELDALLNRALFWNDRILRDENALIGALLLTLLPILGLLIILLSFGNGAGSGWWPCLAVALLCMVCGCVIARRSAAEIAGNYPAFSSLVQICNALFDSEHTSLAAISTNKALDAEYKIHLLNRTERRVRRFAKWVSRFN